MKRLTEKHYAEKGYYMKCSETCEGSNCDTCDSMADIVDRLGEYEDAEERGLLVRLPCKAGDTVYSPRKNGILEQLVDYICMEEDEISIHVSFCCDSDCDGCPHNDWQTTHEGEHYCDGDIGEGIFAANEFGKTVFLTREEAEAALAKEET